MKYRIGRGVKIAQCLHNLQYWRNLDYLGFGAGAHSHYKHSRWENTQTITDYIDSVAKNPKNGLHFTGSNKSHFAF